MEGGVTLLTDELLSTAKPQAEINRNKNNTQSVKVCTWDENFTGIKSNNRRYIETLILMVIPDRRCESG
jgi:hypothetical protein